MSGINFTFEYLNGQRNSFDYTRFHQGLLEIISFFGFRDGNFVCFLQVTQGKNIFAVHFWKSNSFALICLHISIVTSPHLPPCKALQDTLQVYMTFCKIRKNTTNVCSILFILLKTHWRQKSSRAWNHPQCCLPQKDTRESIKAKEIWKSIKLTINTNLWIRDPFELVSLYSSVVPFKVVWIQFIWRLQFTFGDSCCFQAVWIRFLNMA